MMIITRTLKTPIGNMVAGVHDKGLFLLDFPQRNGSLDKLQLRIAQAHNAEFREGDHPLLDRLQAQLDAYFAGALKQFDLPLQLSGSAFQQRVWQELLTIPFGSTRSYMQQAVKLGNPKAIRAVAKANGENCIAVIIPCHRVIGSNGALTGYAGGLPAKKALLELEQQYSGKGTQQDLF
jgi:O-6-methylguanine DNA methyltransferase